MKTTIPVNTQISGIIDTSLNTLHAIYTPLTLTSTTFTFLAAPSIYGSFGRVSDAAGGAYTVTFAAGDVITLDPTIFASLPAVIIVAGSTESTTAKVLELTLIPR